MGLVRSSALLMLVFSACAASGSLPAGEADDGQGEPIWPALFRLAPADAQSLLYINHAHLRSGEGLRALLTAGEPATRRREIQGFAESEDVTASLQLSFASGAEAGTPAANVNLFEARVTGAALARSEIGSVGELPVFRDRRLTGNPARALVLVSSDRVAIGSEAALRGVIDCADGVADNITQVAWIEEAHEALAPLWDRGIDPTVEAWVKISEPMRTALDATDMGTIGRLRWFAVRVTTGASEGGTLTLRALGRASSPLRAEEVAAWLRGRLRDWGALPALVALGLSDFVHAVTVQQHQHDVLLRVDLTHAQWEALGQRLGQISAFIEKNRPESPAPGAAAR